MYLIEIKTDINICDEEFVKSLLNDWYYKIDRRLRPERFGQGEPVKKTFKNEGVETAVKLWLKDKLPLMLKRISEPKFDVDISGYQAMRTDVKQFPSKCTVWLSFKADDSLVLEIFKFLIEKFKPGFGYISTEKDQTEKHFISFKSKIGTIEKYEGLEVGERLPGVYWISYFSKWAINKIGNEKFKNINVHSTEELQNGYLITLYKDSENIGSSKAKDIEAEVIKKLGEEIFFNKSLVDYDELQQL